MIIYLSCLRIRENKIKNSNNRSNVLISEYKLSKNEFDKSIQECKDWYNKSLKV